MTTRPEEAADPQNLAEAIVAQQERCRGILEAAVEIGPPGIFLRNMLRASLKRAEEDVASGDVVRMLRAYHDLSNYKE